MFDENKGDENYLHTVKLKNEQNLVFYDNLTFVNIEMPKFRKLEQELENEFDKWLYFIKNLENFKHIPEKLKNRIFEKTFRTAEIAQFVPAQMDAYQNSLKYYRDMKNVVETSFFEGLLEGKMEGKQEIALNLLAMGLSVFPVVQATGLSESEIEKLRK